MQASVTVVSHATVLPQINFLPIPTAKSYPSEYLCLFEEERVSKLIAEGKKIGLLPMNRELLLNTVWQDFQAGMCYGRVHAFFLEVQRSFFGANTCLEYAVEQMDIHEVYLFQILINVYAKAQIERNKLDIERCDCQNKYEQAKRQITNLQYLRECNRTFYQRRYTNLAQNLVQNKALYKELYETLQADKVEQNRLRFIEAFQFTQEIEKTMASVRQHQNQQHEVIEDLFRKCTNEMYHYRRSIEAVDYLRGLNTHFCQRIKEYEQEYFSKYAYVTCIHQEVVEQASLTDEAINTLFENNSDCAFVEVSIFFPQGPGHAIGLTMAPKFSLYDCNREIELFPSKKELVDGFISYLKRKPISFVNFYFYTSDYPDG